MTRVACSEGFGLDEGEKQEAHGTLRNLEAILKQKQRAIQEGRPHEPHLTAMPGAPAGECGNCYGAGKEGECCNTCEEVREAYQRHGWQFNMKGIPQCEREGFAGDITAQLAAKEG